MITVEEIRDIIEEEVYIGEGTTLGATDAARVIHARIRALEGNQRELVEALNEMTAAAHQAVGHVAAANYPEREREARKWINNVEDKYAALLGRMKVTS
jgi:hypothetical protein